MILVTGALIDQIWELRRLFCPLSLTDLTLAEHGAALFGGALAAHLPDVICALASLPEGQAGVRISAHEPVRAILAPTGPVGALARQIMGADCKAVRAILFDKTADRNWSLAWHQDRTICVRERVDVAGFGPWTNKAGMIHVAPPFDLLARMVTLRIHLDDVPETNAPLLIALGSHRMGRIAEANMDDIVAQCETVACLAEAGDVWAYQTPIVHASAVSTVPARRRVLQVDFSADPLPGGLEWQDE